MEQNINSAIIERLERVVDTLSENSVKMGQLLAVHNEKLDKMWSIFGALSLLSFLVSPVGQRIIRPLLTSGAESTMISIPTSTINEYS